MIGDVRCRKNDIIRDMLSPLRVERLPESAPSSTCFDRYASAPVATATAIATALFTKNLIAVASLSAISILIMELLIIPIL